MKIGHVEIRVRQYADGRWGFDDYSLGQRKKVRLRTKSKAQSKATDTAVVLANGRDDLLRIDRAELAEFRTWKKSLQDSRPISEVLEQFLELKKRKSSRHRQSLQRDLKLFETFVGDRTPIAEIAAPRIQQFLDSRDAGERRRFNLRSAITALFRWSRRMSYLPDRTSEAEKVDPIPRIPGRPNVYSPGDMRKLLDHVGPEFLPWLAIAAFAGVRSEEISPDPNSRKDPLQWEDFDWYDKSIVIRAETSKTREEREIPISENLLEWLAPYRFCIGPVCDRQPTKHETSRLGKFIGGWKHNALRDSYCSYRARLTQNVPQVSYEMGNSIAMVKRSYHRRQPLGLAKEWFDIRPGAERNLIRFPDEKVPKSSKS